MIEMLIFFVSLYIGYRVFKKPGESFFYND